MPLGIQKNKDRAASFEEEVKDNTNQQTISSKIYKWLKSLGIIGSAGSSNSINYIWSGTQTEYDAISSPQDDTLYFIE